MLATLNGQPQQFRMTMQGGPSIEMRCSDFLHTRQEENQLLDNIGLPRDGRVLDWGCGVGRHLSRVRQSRPFAHCCGIDICDLMLDHCRRTIAAPAAFGRSLEEINHHQFDLILLVGNGLGVLGREEDAVVRLRTLVGSLTAAGRVVIETGNPFGRGYSAPDFAIDYGEYHDGPFPWGYADRDWISRTLRELGLGVMIQPSQARGGMFFFAVGQRGEQDGVANGSQPVRDRVPGRGVRGFQEVMDSGLAGLPVRLPRRAG